MNLTLHNESTSSNSLTLTTIKIPEDLIFNFIVCIIYCLILFCYLSKSEHFHKIYFTLH